MTKNTVGDGLETAFWMATGLIFVCGAWQIPAAGLAGDDDPGPRALPLLMSALIIAGGIVTALVAVLRRMRRLQPTIDANATAQGDGFSWQRWCGGVAATTAYALCVSWVGFWLSTVVFLTAWLACSRQPRWQILAVPVALTAAIVLLFGGLLEVQLPRGWASISVRQLPFDIP